MKDFLNNFVGKLKNYVLLILCVLVGVSFVYGLCNIIVGAYSAGMVAYTIFTLIVECGLFVAMLVCYLLKQTKAYNVLTVLYFCYFLLKNLFALPENLCLWYGSVVGIINQVFGLFIIGAIIAIGVLYLIDKIKETNKFGFWINILLFAIVCLCLLRFILAVVDTAVYMTSFAEIFAPFLTIAIVFFYCTVFGAEKSSDDKKEETTQEVEEVEYKDTEKASEEVKEEADAKKNKKSKKAKKEEVVEQPKEEPKKEEVKEEPVAKEVVEEKPAEAKDQDVEVVEEIIYVDEDYEGDDVVEEIVYVDEVVEEKPVAKKPVAKKSTAKSSTTKKASTAKKPAAKKTSTAKKPAAKSSK